MPILLLVSLFLTWLPQPRPDPAPLWTAAIPGRIVAIASAPGGQCTAVVNESELIVLDATGRIAWQAALQDPVDANRGRAQVAMSPMCDWSAVATQAGSVQILGHAGPPVRAAFGDPAVVIDSSTFWPRTMQISPDGAALVIGTERDWLVLVSRAGQVKTWRAGERGEPITAEFASDGTHIVVTGMWTTGVMTMDGAWVWHRTVDVFQISAARDLSAFAAYFTPAHGPPGGDVAILDVNGKTTWNLDVWDPDMAMAPDGSFGAYVAIVSRDMPAWDAPKTLYVADRSGRTLVELSTNGLLHSISADSSCVLVKERAGPDRGFDLVARNRALNEVWRLSAGSSLSEVHVAGALAVQQEGHAVVAYRIPSCR